MWKKCWYDRSDMCVAPADPGCSDTGSTGLLDKPAPSAPACPSAPPPPHIMGAPWSPTLKQPHSLTPSPRDLQACVCARTCVFVSACVLCMPVYVFVPVCACVGRGQKLMLDLFLSHSTLLRQGHSLNVELASPASWPASLRDPHVVFYRGPAWIPSSLPAQPSPQPRHNLQR